MRATILKLVRATIQSLVIFFYFFWLYIFLIFINPPFYGIIGRYHIFELTAGISILISMYINDLLYIDKITSIKENISWLIKFKELYLYIMSAGITIFFVGFASYAIFNSYPSLIFAATTIGVAFVGSYIFLIINPIANHYLEKLIYITLKEANEALNKINENYKSPRYISHLKKYMRLTLRNIKDKLGRGVELKTNNEEDAYFRLEYTLVNYLPYYIKFGNKEQLDSAKKHLETMLNLVDKKDNIKWKPFADELASLNEEVTIYLRENKFNLTYATLPGHLDWIVRNKDLIHDAIKVIALAIPIIYFIITGNLDKLMGILSNLSI